MGRGRRRANQSSGMLTKVKHYARITETNEIAPIDANADENYQFDLSQFPRALALSKNFKFYRAKRVVWTYLPDYNTFQAGGAAVSMPNMALIMNRTGDATSWSAAEYDAQGAVPKLFDKKKIVSYVPNIVQSVQYINNPNAPLFTGNIGTRPVFRQWLATGTFFQNIVTPNGGNVVQPTAGNHLQYFGHSIYWSVTSTAPSEAALGSAFCEVEWEFKDPLFVTTPQVAEPEAPVGAEA